MNDTDTQVNGTELSAPSAATKCILVIVCMSVVLGLNAVLVFFHG